MAALAALSLSVFALCSAEFALIGLLLNVSSDLHVSVASTGQLLSAYALAVAVGGPVVTVLTARVAPKHLALALLLVFVVANVLGALAPTFGTLMAARTLGALTHSTFAAVCILIAVRLSPPGRQASAIAWVAGGLGLATVLGGPIGTAIGEQWGWRATFWSVAGAAVLGFVALARLIPRNLGRGESESMRDELGVLRRPQVLCALAVTAVAQGGWFLLYSYISPLLQHVTGFGPTAATVLLFVFGAGGFIGNALAGKLADRSLRGTLSTMLLVLAGALTLLGFTAESKMIVPAAVFLIGLASGALVPPLQAWVLGAAGGGSALALAANTSAFNLGNALGSWSGSRFLDAGTDVTVLAWIGAGVVLVALAGTVLALRTRPRKTETAQAT
ncbi:MULTISPECIES: MFS transporter [Streptomyces]|uniref:MFS transporter n=1 Tax=Streptomyces TaxID=1883 RepID=UPI001E48D094|nr:MULTISPECIES: MFS transporter [Streptomyces]UFQ17678.1 MFS transporter [Streptomyces huasconensis]WCL87285.1 MFS transporter [Streptomyces sp. JCM 35825]